MLTVFHLKRLTADERKRLNGPNGGWDSEPRFSRYADVTGLAKHDAIREALDLNEFEAVAHVDTADLERAFYLTNNVHQDWQDNDGVTPLGSAVESARSTSVGDLIVDDAGTHHVVEAFGFKRLDLAGC